MESIKLYMVYEYICIFGLSLDAMICRHMEDCSNTTTTKLQKIHDCITRIVFFSAIGMLCSLIVNQ